MKFLGINYGAKRVGVAISDDNAQFAFPLCVVENSGNVVNEISEICKENKVDEIVVGESRNFAQEENEIMKEIIPFKNELGKLMGVRVNLHPEFLTSQEAERIQGKNDMHDASAAALILKSFLDSKNNL